MDRDPAEHDDVLATDDYLHALARRILSGPDGDDLVQEVWLRALRRPPRSGEGEQAWFRTVMRNTRRSLSRGERARARRERTVARSESEGSTRDARPLDALERASLRELLLGHVSALGEPYATVVREHFLEERGIREIALRLGRPEVTVRVQIKRGLDALRIRLAGGRGRSWSLAGGLLGGALARARRLLAGPPGRPRDPWRLLARSCAALGVLIVPAALALRLARVEREDAGGLAPGSALAAERAPGLLAASREPVTPQRAEEPGEGEAPDAPAQGFARRGRVLSAEGEPLSGALVLAGRTGDRAPRPVAVSAPDGSWSAEGLRPYEWLHARPADHPPTAFYAVANAGLVLDLVAAERRGTLDGVVLSAEGLPLSGARVVLRERVWSTDAEEDGRPLGRVEPVLGPRGTLERPSDRQETLADERGRFSFWKLDGARATLIVESERGTVAETVDVEHASDVVLRLPPPTTLEVELVDESGTPCAGALLRATCSKPFPGAEARSDAWGLARLTALPPGPFVLRLLERHDGGLASCVLEGTLAEGESRRERVRLSSASTLHGHVLENGRPLAGWTVRLSQARPSELTLDQRSVQSGPDGSFAFLGVSSDAEHVLLLHPPGRAIPHCERFVRATDSPVTLVPDAVRLAGRLALDASLPAPLALTLVSGHQGSEVFLPLDGSGLGFETSVTPGTHALHVLFPGALGALRIPVEVERDPTEVTLAVPAPGRVSVALDLDPGVRAEEAVVHARVRSIYDAKWFRLPLERDPLDGRFHGTVLAGPVGLVASAPGCADDARRVDVTPGTTAEVQLRLRRGFDVALRVETSRPLRFDEKIRIVAHEPTGPRALRPVYRNLAAEALVAAIHLTPATLRLEASSIEGLRGELVLGPDDLVEGRELLLVVREEAPR